MATTTCSRWIRSTSGRRRPSSRSSSASRILARGASDDKGNIAILIAAVEALLAVRGALPVNLRFVFEGEEESSSVHLEPWLLANRDRLHGDLAIVSDVGFFEGNLPALTVALRGLAYAQIDVRGPFQDLHSGGYGGTVTNPAHALATIIAGAPRCRRSGHRARASTTTWCPSARPTGQPTRPCRSTRPTYQAALDVPALTGEAGYTTLERKSGRPTLDVNGIWGGYQGEGSKTIIPGRASAKVSCRLVPDQRPDRIFAALKAHVLALAPAGVRVTVTDLGGGLPSRTSLDHPAVRAAARALEATFGRPPLFIREGGSIPFVATFEEALGLPVVLMGFPPPDGNFHAPNEWMDRRNFEQGIRAFARTLDELAAPAA